MFRYKILTCLTLSVMFTMPLNGCTKSPHTALNEPEEHPLKDAYTNEIDALFADFTDQTPGIAIAAIRDGELLFEKGYGSANLEYDIPITVDTVFNIGSVSKQVSAFSIFLLAEQGRLSLDDDIRQHIPELPDFDTPITIRHLCNHTSGIPDQWALLTLAGWRMDDVITQDQIFDLISRYGKLNFPPGDEYLYSNTGYMLLAEIVARVSGQSFRDFAKQEIFVPLGMENTQVNDNYRRVVKGRAYSYGETDKGYDKRNLNTSVAGPTGILSSARDLAKWARNFEVPIVGTTEMMTKFNQRALLNSGENAILTVNAGGNVYVASGQFISNFRGTPLYNHTGSTAGFESYLARFPEKNFSVVALSNTENYNIFKNGLAVADVFIGDEIETPPEKSKLSPVASENGDSGLKSPDISELIGQFENADIATSYSIVKNGNSIALKHIRRGTIPLNHTDQDTFNGWLSFPVQVKFQRDSKGKVNEFYISNFGAKNVSFQRKVP